VSSVVMKTCLPLTALFSSPTSQVFGNDGPVLSAVQWNQTQNLLILLSNTDFQSHISQHQQTSLKLSYFGL